MTVAHSVTGRPANVPRLAIPLPNDAADNAAFRRQITLALGSAHGRRSPCRSAIFHVRHGGMFEKQRKSPLLLSSTTARKQSEKDRKNEGLQTSHSARPPDWVTTNQHFAPAFSPASTVRPCGTWYEEADIVYCFFGYIVEAVVPTARQVSTCPRLVEIHYFRQDATLQMMESKKTATSGISRMMALRRPSRLPLSLFRVGADVLINGHRIHLYDADDFTYRRLPDLVPPERAPETDTTFSVTPRRHVSPRYCGHAPQGSAATVNALDAYRCDSGGCAKERSCSQWDAETHESGCFPRAFGGDSPQSQDTPSVLRMYLRWDDTASEFGSVHRYILKYFLEDGTIEMRELADARGGHHCQGRFPIKIRRQKVLKEGTTPTLSVDRIGGDHARSSLRHRQNKNGSGEYGEGVTRESGRSRDGWGGGEDGPTLDPHDLRVGHAVVLMNRPMLVCGWEEAAHVWWENVTGSNMRGLQGDMEEFRQATAHHEQRPRPPNKAKSSFYEGPPQRPGSVRGRFLKASENSGKTLRFMAKATFETQTASTRESLFIIRFYPEDDTLSVYIGHHLGKNAGGIQKGVYLARRGDLINSDTGKPFAAGDFLIGSVARLPSVSLKIEDVDDFSRHYLAQHQHDHIATLATSAWRTVPAWNKLLLATADATNTAEHIDHPSTGTRAVTFGTLAAIPDAKSRTLPVSADKLDEKGNDLASAPKGIGVQSRQQSPSSRMLAHLLWQRVSPNISSSQSLLVEDPGLGESSPIAVALPTWGQLVTGLAQRGLDPSQILNVHERTLLERELMDWSSGANDPDTNSGSGRICSGGESGGRTIHDYDSSGMPSFKVGEIPPFSSRSPSLAMAQDHSGDCSDANGASFCVRSFPLSEPGRVPPLVAKENSPPETERERKSCKADRAGGRSRGDCQSGVSTVMTAAGESTVAAGGEEVVVWTGQPLNIRDVAIQAHEVPSTGREDAIVQAALVKLVADVFGHGGAVAVQSFLKAEGKTTAHPADLRTMCRLLMAVAGLSFRDTRGLWLKFMPTAVALAEADGRVTFAGFLECIRSFEACLRRGELLGLSSIDPKANDAGTLAD